MPEMHETIQVNPEISKISFEENVQNNLEKIRKYLTNKDIQSNSADAGTEKNSENSKVFEAWEYPKNPVKNPQNNANLGTSLPLRNKFEMFGHMPDENAEKNFKKQVSVLV